MKNFLFIIPMIILLSCVKTEPRAPYTKIPPVTACFKVQPAGDLYVNQNLIFVNCSNYGSSFSWDFGDGTTSNLEDPTHSYSQPGGYYVVLKAIHQTNSDTMKMHLNILEKPFK